MNLEEHPKEDTKTQNDVSADVSETECERLIARCQHLKGKLPGMSESDAVAALQDLNEKAHLLQQMAADLAEMKAYILRNMPEREPLSKEERERLCARIARIYEGN